MSEQEARVELTADTRSFAQKLADARKRWIGFGRGLAKGAKAFGKEVGKGFGSAFGKMSKRAFSFGTTAMGIGGAVGIAAAFGNEAQKSVNFEELTRLQIASRGALGNLDEFRAKVLEVSTATGLARTEVLRGAAAYVTLTGDAEAAKSSMELFARIQRATGATMEDIAASAAAMAQNLKIDPSKFEKAFSILIAGGKAGSVELRDLAGLLANLAPLAERFAGGAGTGGLANLGAALQLARQGFGTASEAATGLEALMGAIVQNADKLKAAGIKVFTKDAKTGKKELRGLQQIVEAIGNSKLAKDPSKLVKALGRKEALAAFIQLTKVKGAWTDLTQQTMTANDVAEDYAAFQESTAGRLHDAYNQLQNVIASVFTPERIVRFGAALERVARLADGVLKTFERMADFLVTDAGEAAQFREESLKEMAGVSDRVLRVRAQAGDPVAEAALEGRAFQELERRFFDRATEVMGGAPAVNHERGKMLDRPSGGAFDTEAEARAREEALSLGMGVLDTSHPEVRRRIQVDVTPIAVKVTAGPGLRAQVDNDPRQRVTVSP